MGPPNRVSGPRLPRTSHVAPVNSEEATRQLAMATRVAPGPTEEATRGLALVRRVALRPAARLSHAERFGRSAAAGPTRGPGGSGALVPKASRSVDPGT